jgi:hypothetical protein
VDHDALAGGDRPRYALDGIAHAVHGRAIVQLIEPWAQESLGAIYLGEAAAREQRADGRRQPKRGIQRRYHGGVWRVRKDPARTPSFAFRAGG